jgi:hypothetical protein
MKRSKFTEQQIAFALKQAELGTAVDDVCRKLGISEAVLQLEKEIRRPGTVRAASTAATRRRE